ncbi:MAG TPA: hypothetical protein PKE31_11655 [Pseudomonadota bacterium]|jgi:hypothetical protein|nr:hypothetical protein [Pseudomonadota bacterium]
MSTKKKSEKNPAAESASPKPSVSRTPAEAYTHYLPDAQKLSAQEVQPCRMDVPLAWNNVKLGVEAVLSQKERLKREVPGLPLAELAELPDLCAALLLANDKVLSVTNRADTTENLRRLRALREPMLLIAEGLALHGLLPPDRVQKIRAGTGNFDAAMDGIALEALYREFKTPLAGKHPFTEAELAEIGALGNRLVHAITPEGGRTRPVETSESSNLRDRFYTLVLRRHALLRKAGFYLYGEAINDHVPALQSRMATGKPKSPKPAATPSSPDPASPKP